VLADEAAGDVERPARRKGDDKAHRPRRKIGRPEWKGAEQEYGNAKTDHAALRRPC
jgi:hypothetical protein